MGSWWPDWLTYPVILRALHDLAGPYAKWYGLAIITILVVGLFVKLVYIPIRRRG